MNREFFKKIFTKILESMKTHKVIWISVAAAVLVVAIVLTVCLSIKRTATPSTNPTDNTTESTGETTQETTQESTGDTTEETQEQVVYYHPLTGEQLEEPWSGHLIAVMTNNIKYAMPQHGISQADIIYEMEEEGSITRNMAIFSDLSDVEAIGSIRSARTYFVSVAAAYDAYLVHCGASVHARNGKYNQDGDKVPDWKDLDQSYNGSYFYRDKDRYNNGYAWEHTLFTTGEKMQQILADKELSQPYENGFGLQFEENVQHKGEQANKVVITFKGGKTSTFTYDGETGLYTRSQYGSDSVDGNTGEAMTVKNVIAIYTKQWYCSCGLGHQFYDTIGSGEGYAAINGTIVPILWNRDSLDSPFTYTLGDGTPLTLDVGSTYIAFSGIKNPIAYE